MSEEASLKELEKDFRWRAAQCRTNPDAFDLGAAAVWDFAGDAVRAKMERVDVHG